MYHALVALYPPPPQKGPIAPLLPCTKGGIAAQAVLQLYRAIPLYRNYSHTNRN